MIKIALFGVGAALLFAWIKGVKTEYGLWVLVVAGASMGYCIVEQLNLILVGMSQLSGFFSTYAPYVKVLVKILGITYLSEISANLCKDAGAGVLAAQVELFGKLSILLLCIPVVLSLLEALNDILGG